MAAAIVVVGFVAGSVASPAFVGSVVGTVLSHATPALGRLMWWSVRTVVSGTVYLAGKAVSGTASLLASAPSAQAQSPSPSPSPSPCGNADANVDFDFSASASASASVKAKDKDKDNEP